MPLMYGYIFQVSVLGRYSVNSWENTHGDSSVLGRRLGLGGKDILLSTVDHR